FLARRFHDKTLTKAEKTEPAPHYLTLRLAAFDEHGGCATGHARRTGRLVHHRTRADARARARRTCLGLARRCGTLFQYRAQTYKTRRTLVAAHHIDDCTRRARCAHRSIRD